MHFWASAEVYQPADAALDKVRRFVVPVLNAAFAASDLRNLNCKLRYVPIVMPKQMHLRYPARSRLRKSERIYDCAPILDYDVFVDRNFEDQLKEYIRGILLSAPHLADLGASPRQIEEFEKIVLFTIQRVLSECADQVRN